jgi:hypothetical protein
MTKLTDDELGALIDAEFEQAMGTDGGEISTERAKAWDYYLSKPIGNEIEGESAYVTSDVADSVDGAMTSLLKIYTTEDNLVMFDPVGPEDVDAAEQESDYANYCFFKQNPAYLILYTWFFDALVQKNGIVKSWWDESEEITTERYQGLNDQEVAGLMEDPELEARYRRPLKSPEWGWSWSRRPSTTSNSAARLRRAVFASRTYPRRNTAFPLTLARSTRARRAWLVKSG